MDINMSIMTGLEAIKIIKKKYAEANQRALNQEHRRTPIIRPVIIFFSQYNPK